MLTGAELEASDDRQLDLKDLDRSIAQIAGRDPLTALKYVEERIALLVEDNYPDPCEYIRSEMDAFQICMQEKSGALLPQAPWWIAQAYLHSVTARGAGHPQTIKMMNLMEDPCSLPSIKEGIQNGLLPADFKAKCTAVWAE